MAVTRTELADHVAAAFRNGPATRDTLIAAAVASSAGPEVIEALNRLPATNFAATRDLWYHLADLPIGQ